MPVCAYVYMLQQHMVVTCCQGSLSPGLASPALGQMAAHWALKSNCAAQDTRPALSSYLGSSCLLGGLLSYSTSSHAKTPLCAGGLWFNLVSIQAEWERKLNKQNGPIITDLSLTCSCRDFADNIKNYGNTSVKMNYIALSCQVLWSTAAQQCNLVNIGYENVWYIMILICHKKIFLIRSWY